MRGLSVWPPLSMSPDTDSAGVPFQGRSFRPHPFAGDDGSAPVLLAQALQRYGLEPSEEALSAVVHALRSERVLVPLLAEAGAYGTTTDGRVVEKSQELSVVSVAGPDGEPMGVAFSTAALMAQWNKDSRPVPSGFDRVAAWALGEGIPRVVLDPTGPAELVLRRSALVAVVTGEPFLAPWSNPEVLQEIRRGIEGSLGSVVEVVAGSTPGRPEGADVRVTVSLPLGLDREDLARLESDWAFAWSKSPVINRLVDGIALKLVSRP